MIRGLAALILLHTLSLIQTSDVPDQMPLTVVELGDNLTLTCPFVANEAGLFYWYKLKFGHMVQTIAAGTFDKITLQEPFENSRFATDKVNDQFVLDIRNVSKEDEATYFCQAGSAYIMKFINGTLLAVNDHKNQRKSFYVEQSPETESVEPGGSVNLSCALLSKDRENPDQCPGEHSVYWFRSGSGESHPSVLYTDSNEPEERSCFYSFSKTIRDSSDDGTYYCAVITCGEILFGEGTQVETREPHPFVPVLGTLLACCVIVIAALIICRNQKSLCQHCKGESYSHDRQVRSAEDQLDNVNGEAVALNYVALDFPSRKTKRWKNSRELPQDCLYAEAREYQ